MFNLRTKRYNYSVNKTLKAVIRLPTGFRAHRETHSLFIKIIIKHIWHNSLFSEITLHLNTDSVAEMESG